MFKFDLIAYDEIEDFTYPYSSPLFNYPFKNQKNNIHHYELDHASKTSFSDELYIKKSEVCLEKDPWS